jgi:DNA mismatch endonuclease (patch repair protein)
MPASNEQFWREKLSGNLERDRQNIGCLLNNGWRVLIIWECVTKSKEHVLQLGDELKAWILGNESFRELPGTPL